MRGLMFLVVLLGVGAFAYFNYFGGSRPATTPTAAAPTSGPIPTAGPGEVKVEVDEGTLTRELNAAIAGQTVGQTPIGAATARDLAVQLRGGQMTITGQAVAGAASVPISISGVISAQAGKPVVDVRDARISGVPLPDGARDQIEKSIQGQLDQAVSRDRVQVRAVAIENGTLTMVGSR